MVILRFNDSLEARTTLPVHCVSICTTCSIPIFNKLKGTIGSLLSADFISFELEPVWLLNPDGTFSDTLKVVTGNYNFFDGLEGTSMYLKNGFDLVISGFSVILVMIDIA